MNIPIHYASAILLCMLMALISSCGTETAPKKFDDLTDQDYKHESDTVGGDTVYFKTATAATTPQKITSLNDGQKLFIRNCLLGADSMIRMHYPNKSTKNLTPKFLDEIINEWNDDSLKFNCTREHFVNCIGATFGQYLIKACDMEWKIVTDKYGSEYATMTTIEGQKLINYPLNSVLKAVEEKREAALITILLMDRKEIDGLRQH